MRDYDSSLEPTAKRKQHQPEGVSEANKEKNHGWGHRTQVTRNQYSEHREESISKVVSERIDGELVTLSEIKRKQQNQADNHGESHPNDYEFGRPLTKAEKAARKFGEYWPESKQEDFLENDTDLSAADLNWE